jgi:hypothetical protein
VQGVADCLVLGAALRANTSLKTLDLSDNERLCVESNGDDVVYELRGLAELAITLAGNSTLTRLNLGRTGLRVEGARELANAITPSTALDVVIVHTVRGSVWVGLAPT